MSPSLCPASVWVTGRARRGRSHRLTGSVAASCLPGEPTPVTHPQPCPSTRLPAGGTSLGASPPGGGAEPTQPPQPGPSERPFSSQRLSVPQEADRAVCSSSALHQADQALRRIVSQTMKEAKGTRVVLCCALGLATARETQRKPVRPTAGPGHLGRSVRGGMVRPASRLPGMDGQLPRQTACGSVTMGPSSATLF